LDDEKKGPGSKDVDSVLLLSQWDKSLAKRYVDAGLWAAGMCDAVKPI
jgi:hypothetical protein